MVSSAIYRYFPSRDDLLTTLIIDGYNALGEAVERAEAAGPRDDHVGRWLTACHAVRDWAVAHPHEYALIYGSPVPGYQAPQDTIAARLRDVTVLSGIVTDAWRAGALRPPVTMPAPPPELEPEAAGIRALMPEVPPQVIWAALAAWTSLYGWVNFEVFGQFANTIDNRRAAFDHSMRLAAAAMGLVQ
jgi:AcrR family transcriptional regulator